MPPDWDDLIPKIDIRHEYGAVSFTDEIRNWNRLAVSWPRMAGKRQLQANLLAFQDAMNRAALSMADFHKAVGEAYAFPQRYIAGVPHSREETTLTDVQFQLTPNRAGARTKIHDKGYAADIELLTGFADTILGIDGEYAYVSADKAPQVALELFTRSSGYKAAELLQQGSTHNERVVQKVGEASATAYTVNGDHEADYLLAKAIANLHAYVGYKNKKAAKAEAKKKAEAEAKAKREAEAEAKRKAEAAEKERIKREEESGALRMFNSFHSRSYATWGEVAYFLGRSYADSQKEKFVKLFREAKKPVQRIQNGGMIVNGGINPASITFPTLSARPWL